MIEIGVIGCGAVVHLTYARTLVGHAEYAVRYVYDLDPVQAASGALLFGAKAVSLEEICERADAIVISTPPSTHAEVITQVLATGRTILCEKPFTTNQADAELVTAAAREAGARLYVGHFRRLFPQIQLARNLVGLGLIGDVQEITASEGGRFTWSAVSSYTSLDASGGVLWDTGSHTLDSALFTAGLDGNSDLAVLPGEIERDRAEPSHDFRAAFTLTHNGCEIGARLHVSRKDALPNLITVRGTRGTVGFVAGLDDRLRLTTASGSSVLLAQRSHADLLECFDLQFRRVFLNDGADMFGADRFIGQIGVLEALSNA